MILLKNKSEGFTLVEVIISVFLGVILMFVISELLISVFSNPPAQITSMDNIEQSKRAVSTFAEELRNAAIGNDGSYSITEAQDNEIIFYSNFRTTGAAVNRIRYYLSGNTLYKGVVAPAGNPLSYNLASEVIRSVVTVVSNGVDPAFYYYDGNYNGSGSQLPQPVNINQIRFVKINLLIKNQITKQSDSTFPISAGVTVRNLKDNLGN